MAYTSPFSDLNQLAEEYDMLPRGATVLCAVSGGADSIYLLHRLALLRATLGFTLVAAHYNHHLRGAESDRDEAFVRDFAARYCGGETVSGPEGEAPLPPVELIVGRGDVAGTAKAQGTGIEETARELRYAFLRETAQQVGADRIATAHNAEDNTETVLLHLIRGAGLQGLTGIAPRRGELIRPLLTTPRAAIEEYLRRYGLPHVEDSSNADDSYSRNKLRHQVMPLLEELGPGFVRRMTQAIPRLRADNDYLNAQAANICQKARWAEDDLVIEARYIAGLPPALAPRAARRLIEMMGDGSTDCSAAHLNGIVELCRGGDPSAVLFLPHGLMAQRVYQELLLTTQSPPLPPLEPFVPKEGANPVPGTGWVLHLDGPPWPGLVLRSRQVGDEIALPGRGTRSLKRLFIDQKIPRKDREQIPVAADEAGVLAVAGFGPNTAHPRYGKTEISFTTETEEG